MDLEKLCLKVCELTDQTGKFILAEKNRLTSAQVELKGHNDLVSYVDKTAEEMLVKGLEGLIAGSGFITEENTQNQKGESFSWIIDPLDGTTNYVHGLPCFCISIGLLRDDKVVLGVVNELNRKECFYAWENGGAFMNGDKIKVSGISRLSDSLLATGFPYHDYDRMEAYMKVFDYCLRNTHGLRRLGSAAADLAYVACGRFEAFYEYGLNAWDVAGGACLVQEAGGIVSDFKGASDFIFGKEIIASNSLVHAEFLEVVKGQFK